MNPVRPVEIVGGGVAGLRAALAVDPRLSLTIVTKDDLLTSSSQWAQGGIAGVVEHLRPDRFDDEIGEPRIGLIEPAAEGDAVRLVDDALGIQPVQIAKHRLAHQIGMQRGDAIHRMRSDKGEMAHADAAPGLLVDKRHRGAEFDIARAALLGEAMAGLGDPFAIHAFCSNSRDEVRYYRVKDFAEPYGAVTRARLAGLRGMLSTRLGAALRQAGVEVAEAATLVQITFANDGYAVLYN